MAISPINPVAGEDVWQMSQTTRQQTAALQTTAVAAPGGAAKTGAGDNAGNAENTDGKEAGASLQNKQAHEVLESINHTFKMLEIGLQFEIDSDYKDVIVKVVDKESGNVIRQIPSEAMVRVAKEIDKLKGLLVEQTA
jgi:flagellar protein FlaG